MASRHEQLVDAILLALGSQENIRCWRTQVGRYRMLYSNRVVTIGPEGVGDIEGIIGPYGIYFNVECKYGRDTQRDTQEAFELVVLKFGGIYVVAYSVDEARERIKEGVERWKAQTFGYG